MLLKNQSGHTVNITIEIDDLPNNIAGVTTAQTGVEEPLEFLVTINSRVLAASRPRAIVTLVHELLHCINWAAGHNKHRHKSCHYLACALVYGTPLKFLKIRSPRIKESVTLMMKSARQWIKDNMTTKYGHSSRS